MSNRLYRFTHTYLQTGIDIPGALYHRIMYQQTAVNTTGMGTAQITFEARCTCCHPHSTDPMCLSPGHHATILESSQHGRAILKHIDHLRVTVLHLIKVFTNQCSYLRSQRIVSSTTPNQPLGKTVAAPTLRCIDDDGPQSLTRDLPQLKPNVHAQGSSIGQMQSDALHLQSNRSFKLQTNSD